MILETSRKWDSSQLQTKKLWKFVA